MQTQSRVVEMRQSPERAGWLFVALAGVFGCTAVAAGAFAAHGLAGMVTAERAAAFRTAAEYQMYHAIALLAVGVLVNQWGGRWLATAGWLFAVGTVVFSGSLYLLVLTDTPWLARVTPFGGAALLLGWLSLMVAAIRQGPPSTRSVRG